MAVRYGGHVGILEGGFVPVARSFLDFAAKLKPYALQPAEILFVINLLYHKWDAAKPFPSYKTLAGRMGISISYARDLGRKLERKGLLTREIRVGAPNRFDLTPLFDALAKHIAQEASLHQARQKKVLKVV